MLKSVKNLVREESTMSRVARYAALSLVIMLVACRGAQAPMTDAQRSTIRDALIATHNEMLASASAVDADGLFSHFVDNRNGVLAYDGALIVTRESALKGLREAYSGLEKIHFTMDEEHVSVISPETAVYTGLGKSSTLTKAGETIDAPFAVSIVFVLRDGEWKVLHLHESLPNPAL